MFIVTDLLQCLLYWILHYIILGTYLHQTSYPVYRIAFYTISFHCRNILSVLDFALCHSTAEISFRYWILLCVIPLQKYPFGIGFCSVSFHCRNIPSPDLLHCLLHCILYCVIPLQEQTLTRPNTLFIALHSTMCHSTAE